MSIKKILSTGLILLLAGAGNMLSASGKFHIGKMPSLPIIRVSAPGLNKQSKKAVARIINFQSFTSVSTGNGNDTSILTDLEYGANHIITGANSYRYDNNSHQRLADTRNHYSGFLAVDPTKIDRVGGFSDLYEGLVDSFERDLGTGSQSLNSFQLNYFIPQKETTQYLVSGKWVDSVEIDITYGAMNNTSGYISKGYINGVWKTVATAKTFADSKGNLTGEYIITSDDLPNSLAGNLPQGVIAQLFYTKNDKSGRVASVSENFYYDPAGTSYDASKLVEIVKQTYYYNASNQIIAARMFSDTNNSGTYFKTFFTPVNDSFSNISYLRFIPHITPSGPIFYGGSEFKSYTSWTYDNNAGKLLPILRYTATKGSGNFYTQLNENYSPYTKSFINNVKYQIFTGSGGSYDHNLVTRYDTTGTASNEVEVLWTISRDADGDITQIEKNDSTLSLNGFVGYGIHSKVIYEYNTFTGINENGTVNSRASIVAYPNPFGDRISIKGLTQPANILITDISGRTIMSVSASPAEVYTLNTSTLPAGIYIIRITDTNGIQNLRLMKI